MAVEDALVLAKCLRDSGDTRQAFVTYEGVRRGRVERVVRYSRRIGSTKIAGPIGRFFRDLMMPIGLGMFATSEANAWLFRHHVEWGS